MIATARVLASILGCGLIECAATCSDVDEDAGLEAHRAELGVICFEAGAFESDDDGPSTPLASVDLDNNGVSDLAYMDDGALVVQSRGEDGRLGDARASEAKIDADVVELLPVDLTGDGVIDIVAVTNSTAESWIAEQNGRFSRGATIDLDTERAGLGSVAAADFDDDGSVELVVAVAKRVELLSLDLTGAVAERAPILSGDEVGPVLAFDFSEPQGTAVALQIDGTLAFMDLTTAGAMVPIASAYLGTTRLAAGDLDGDGHDEVVSVDAGSTLSIYGLRGDGTLGLVEERLHEGGYGMTLALGDVDGDDRLDIVLSDPAGAYEDSCGNAAELWRGTVSVSLATGFDDYFTHRQYGEHAPGIVDLDGDGVAELVVGDAVARASPC